MEYLLHILIYFAIYALLGISLNLIAGYTGLLSITHASFFGIGAYAVAILTTQFGLGFFGAALIGMVLAGIGGLIIGWVLSRLSGDYYMLGTVGFSYIIFAIMMNWSSLTRGPLGIPAIPRPSLFGLGLGDNLKLFLLLLFVLLVIYLLSRKLVASSFGRVLRAIREDENALRVFGYETTNYKLAIFAIAAGMAAMAGAFLATYITFVDPLSFTIMESVFIMSIVIFGGFASLEGSLLGAFLLVLLPELLRFMGLPSEIAGHVRQGVYGLLLVLFMMYWPKGLMGKYKV